MDINPNGRTAHTWATVTYPLLVVRLFAAEYHLRPLPADLSRAVLTSLAWAAMDACNRQYQMCLVFAPNEALYLFQDGRSLEYPEPPSGGLNSAFFPRALDFLPEPVDGGKELED